MSFNRTSYDSAIGRLNNLIGDQYELAVRVRELFVHNSDRFRYIVLKTVPAGSALESDIILEPSDLFRKLLVAITANDWDQIGVIEHDILSGCKEDKEQPLESLI